MIASGDNYVRFVCSACRTERTFTDNAPGVYVTYSEGDDPHPEPYHGALAMKRRHDCIGQANHPTGG